MRLGRQIGIIDLPGARLGFAHADDDGALVTITSAGHDEDAQKAASQARSQRKL